MRIHHQWYFHLVSNCWFISSALLNFVTISLFRVEIHLLNTRVGGFTARCLKRTIQLCDPGSPHMAQWRLQLILQWMSAKQKTDRGHPTSVPGWKVSGWFSETILSFYMCLYWTSAHGWLVFQGAADQSAILPSPCWIASLGCRYGSFSCSFALRLWNIAYLIPGLS